MKPYTKQTLQKYESGQAIILIAFMIIALLGITGVAIDGGGLYFLHRDTQNAVDAAVLAATFAKCTTVNNTYTEQVDQITNAAEISLHNNAYDHDSNGVEVDIIANYDPETEAAAADGVVTPYVKVTLTAVKPSYFVQLVYAAPLSVISSSVGNCSPPGQGLIPNYAIVSLRPHSECSNSANHAAAVFTGDPTLTIRNSGIYSNSDHGTCAIDSDGHARVVTEGDCSTVGGYKEPSVEDWANPDEPPGIYCEGGATHPTSPMTDYNPLSDWQKPDDFCGQDPEPESAGSVGPGGEKTISPGHYTIFDVKGTLSLENGIYCVEQVNIGAQGLLRMAAGDDDGGVILYMPPDAGWNSAHPRWDSNGRSNMVLRAPTDETCVNTPTTGNTCRWPGLLVWADIEQANGCDADADDCNGGFQMNGGSASKFSGMVYAPGSQCEINGNNESFAFAAQVVCWSLKFSGTADWVMDYEPAEFLNTPPSISYAQ